MRRKIREGVAEILDSGEEIRVFEEEISGLRRKIREDMAEILGITV